MNIHWKDWCWSFSTLATWCKELTNRKRPWCWERLKTGGEGDGRGWDGWMVSPTRWTWVWASSRSWWWTGKPVVVQTIGSQNELNWNFPGLSEKWMWVYHMTTPPPPWPRHILQQYKVAEAGSSYLHPHPTIKFSVCVSNLPSWLSLVTATSWVPLLIDKLVVLSLMLIAERVVSSKFVSGFLWPS